MGRVSVWDDEAVLETDDDEGCTAIDALTATDLHI